MSTTGNNGTTVNNTTVTLDSRTFAVPGANEFNTPTNFIILVVTILIVWVLIDLFTRFMFNMSYNTLGLDSSSTIHSLLVLIFVTVFLVATVWVIDRYGLIEGGLTGSVVGIGAPIVDVSTTSTSSSGTDDDAGAVGGRNGTFVSER